MFRRSRSLMIALILIFALVVPVSAHSSDPSRPEVLTVGVPIFDDLVGGTGGSFAYFAIDYTPGDWVTLHTYFNPSDNATLNAVGVNIYGQNGKQIGAGGATYRHGELDWEGKLDTAQRLLVQIYNYIPGFRVSFGIVLETGTSFGQSRYNLALEAYPNNDPSRPHALPLNTVIHSRLFDEEATAWAYYLVQHPGANQMLTIMASFTPNDKLTMDAVGMHIHEVGGVEIDPVAVASTTSSAGILSYSVRLAQPHAYMVEVFNKSINDRVDFHIFATTDELPAGAEGTGSFLQVEGFEVGLVTPGEVAAAQPSVPTGTAQPAEGTPPGEVAVEMSPVTPAVPSHSTAPVTPGMSGNPDAPVALQINGPRVGGPLSGDRAGLFSFYELELPADEPVTIHLLVDPANLTDTDGVGLNIYDPEGDLVGEANLDEAGHYHLAATSEVTQRVLVQVYNYLPGALANIQVFATAAGLPASPSPPAGQPTPGEVAAAQPGVSTGTAQPTVGTTPGEVATGTAPATPVVPSHPTVPVTPGMSGDPLAPIALAINGARLGGVLGGDRAGRFSFYAVDLPAGTPVTIHLLIDPANLTDSNGVGLNVYEPEGDLAGEAALDEAGHYHLVVTSDTAQRLLVQVFNYLPLPLATIQVFATS